MTATTEEMALELQGSFILFCQTFFPIVTGRDFIMSHPDGQESHFIQIARELTKIARCEERDEIINVPPGSGKSTLLAMWVAWTMSKYPDSNFLYISYSQTLAAKHTEFIKRVMMTPEYRAMFHVELRKDSRAKDFFMTTANGSIKAFGSGGAITGQDAGLPNLDRFSGAVICFPYDEIVYTENGPKKIGEIVEEGSSINVWSENVKTGKTELKRISGWHENPGSEILEIIMSDGGSLKCTPCHQVWTQNRGWVRAENLRPEDVLLSPSPDCALWDTQQLSGAPLRDGEVCQDFHVARLEVAKFVEFLSSWLAVDDVMSVTFSDGPTSNFVDNDVTGVVDFSNFFSAFAAYDDFSDIATAEPGARVTFPFRECAVPLRVLDVLGPRGISEICEMVVSFVAVNMARIAPARLFANKGEGYQAVYESVNSFSIKPKCGPLISSVVDVVGENSLFVKRSNAPKIRNHVHAIKTRNVTPIFIRSIGHVNKTYCITVDDNHNFYAGGTQEGHKLRSPTCVRNCDDMHKPDDIHSDTIRESVIKNYRETILQRPRGPNVPIIFIGQRLHEADLAAFMMSGKDERVYKRVIIPGIDQAGNSFYPEVYPIEMLREKQLKSPYVFSSQFQQDPIPAGGAVFKKEYFVTLDTEPEILVTFITADTAETSKQHNDASVFSFWGLYKIKEGEFETGALGLHWLDCEQIWVEPKDLKDEFMAFYTSCMRHKVRPQVAAIEKKSTGTTLISLLQGVRGLEVRDIKRSRASGSKADRFLEIQPIVASRTVSFTQGARHINMCIEHMSKITANDTHRNDDIADTLYDACKIALLDRTIYHEKDKTDGNVTKSIAASFNAKNSRLTRARYG